MAREVVEIDIIARTTSPSVANIRTAMAFARQQLIA
eukprot:CAMPEP_0201519456 /NCGR_PEP_ID=MMETSP0161_2-20130828/10006_1 /ASSEMBLY_ACC=CAM_ASM_000251 /TAXON_ID=180227 /ORGANISM="Neoparamoeba aestuarina, Strain SoJaBio B1-5/56/2" /LENGTH=35 /DNA_ID= /DNA_START= /DNA_END= /DNA_ORIENTATION=